MEVSRRATFKRKRSSKGFRASKKQKTSLTTSQKAQVQSMMTRRAETKIHPIFQTVAVSNIGTITALTAITQGDTRATRDGDKIYLRDISFSWEAKAADTTQYCRFVVFQWHRGTTPTSADILDPSSAGALDFMAGYNEQFLSYYTILDDWAVALAVNAGPANACGFYEKRDGFRRTVNYLPGTSSAEHGIWLLMISDSSVSTHPDFRFAGTVHYQDS